jgi:hypothetical protein
MNKYFSRRWFPPIFLEQISFLRGLLKFIGIRRHLNRNKKLRNSHAGKSIYILGNGPSLNNFDLTTIFNQEVITMNHFELHPQKNNFRIVAHCIGEPYSSSTWEDPMRMINGVSADMYWVNADAIPYFSNKVDNDIYYYFPWVGPDALLQQGDDISRAALRYQSTAQMAINIALFLGFKDIYLLGFDHDWLTTRGHSPHFYKEEDGVDKADLSIFPYIDMIRMSLNLFEIYVKLDKIAKKCGARIWNLSKPSYLDVFPAPELPQEPKI